MSLYSDLNEVLTPYATKIKGLTAANEELKADLVDNVNDLKSALNDSDDYIGFNRTVVETLTNVGTMVLIENTKYPFVAEQGDTVEVEITGTAFANDPTISFYLYYSGSSSGTLIGGLKVNQVKTYVLSNNITHFAIYVENLVSGGNISIAVKNTEQVGLTKRIADLETETDSLKLTTELTGLSISESINSQFNLYKDASSNKLFNVVNGITPAYSQSVPEDTFNYAVIRSIGGKTIRENNAIYDSRVTSIVSKDSSNDTVQTITVPQSLIDMCDSYGAGLTSGYNEIKFYEHKYYQRVKRVALSSLNWTTSGVAGRYFAQTLDRKYGSDFLCDRYATTSNYQPIENKVIYGQTSYYGAKTLAVWDSDYQTLSAFKASLDGLYICYPLDDEIITNLPDAIMPIVINVDEGGTITFSNNNNESVNNAVEYYIKTSFPSIENLSIFTLDQFEGNTLEDKLHNALDTVTRGYILCGEINITKQYTALNKNYSNIFLVGGTFIFGTFNGAWFNQDNSEYNTVVGFSCCYLYGHGNTIFSTLSNVTKPKFCDCKLYNINIANSPTHYVQSLYLLNTDIDATDVLAKADYFYDLKMIGCRIEMSANFANKSVDDTLFIATGMLQAIISSSLVESRNNEVVKTGYARGLVIENCYFECLKGGLLSQTGSQGDCAITVSNNSFIGNEFTSGYIVNIASSKYNEPNGTLVCMNNYINQSFNFCNVSKCYITSTDNTRKEILFDSSGVVKWSD